MIFARIGSVKLIGCTKCVNEEIKKQLAINLLCGWWCFPWGLFTPLVLIQNFYVLHLKSKSVRKKLYAELIAIGINPYELEVDAEGFTEKQRYIMSAILGILSKAVYVDEKYEERMRNAIMIISAVVENAISGEQIKVKLQNAFHEPIEAKDFPEELKSMIFRMVLQTLEVDGKFSDNGIKFVFRVGRAFKIPSGDINKILSSFSTCSSSSIDENDPEYIKACNILNVKSNASIVEIKNIYRKLMLKYHPDFAGTDKKKQSECLVKSTQINWAYQYLKSKKADEPY